MAVAYISQNGNGLFKAAIAEYNNPFLYGNADGSLTTEQRTLPGHEAHPQVGIAAGAAMGLVTLGTVAPSVATAWALGATYDYAGDVISQAMGLSTDGPNVAKSLTVGGVTGAMAPLFLPLNTLGNATGGKVVLGVYNSLVGGVGAFGAAAITRSGNPDLAAGLGAGSAAAGRFAQYAVPGPAGKGLGYLFDVIPGPMQSTIERSKKGGGASNEP